MRAVPASPERLDQIDRRHHLSDLQRYERLMIGKQRRLCCEYVKVWIDPCLIARHREIEVLMRGVDRFLLAPNFLRVNADCGEVILYLLESRKHSLPICGEVRSCRRRCTDAVPPGKARH